MPNEDIKVGGYVVAIKNIHGIQERSVGLVQSISGADITVFFIGANKLVQTDKNHITYLLNLTDFLRGF